MRKLSMLPGRAKMTRPLYQFGHSPRDWRPIKAHADVIAMPAVEPGDWVDRGQELARVTEIDRPDKERILRAPISGIVGTTMPSSAVHKGETVIVLRRAKRLNA